MRGHMRIENDTITREVTNTLKASKVNEYPVIVWKKTIPSVWL